MLLLGRGAVRGAEDPAGGGRGVVAVSPGCAGRRWRSLAPCAASAAGCYSRALLDLGTAVAQAVTEGDVSTRSVVAQLDERFGGSVDCLGLRALSREVRPLLSSLALALLGRAV